ncbi:MAG: Asp23/Gls24 family envelope stress response protein [Adlercreutzia equolifaciens]
MVAGVCAPNAADSIARSLPASRLRRGMVVKLSGRRASQPIVVEYGTNIATVSRNLIDQVSFALKEYARVPLAGVDIPRRGCQGAAKGSSEMGSSARLMRAARP